MQIDKLPFRLTGTESARVIFVIETKSKQGIGTENDPIREVVQYWDVDGNLLAEKRDV